MNSGPVSEHSVLISGFVIVQEIIEGHSDPSASEDIENELKNLMHGAKLERLLDAGKKALDLIMTARYSNLISKSTTLERKDPH